MRVERIIAGPLQANCYVVADDNGDAAVIDPGGSASEVEDVVEANGWKLTKMLLTHGHPDHTFAAGRLQQIYDVDMVMHRSDVDQMSEGLEMAELFYDMSQFVPARPTQFVQDGDTVKVGDLDFLVIHTPGHTPGGLCYLRRPVIFTGDTLFASSIGRTDLPGGSYEQLMDSIKGKLLVLEDDLTVYPGHGGETSIGVEKQFNPFIG